MNIYCYYYYLFINCCCLVCCTDSDRNLADVPQDVHDPGLGQVHQPRAMMLFNQVLLDNLIALQSNILGRVSFQKKVSW